MIPFLSQLYSKANPGKLWVDLGGEVDWEDILSREGVHQGCSFGSFLSSLGLQPVLREVAAGMQCGLVAAFCDDVKICGPPKVAHQAYVTLIELARECLGIEEVPSKGSLMWEGEGSPDLDDFPDEMPGVSSRITHDRHLGVFIGDSRPGSVADVKHALMDKFVEKARLISRLSIITDPQVKFQLLRCCASTRPGFWLRTMGPDLTFEAAQWYDTQLRACMSDMFGLMTDEAWALATLPTYLSGRGLISAVHSRHAAHAASWFAAFHNMSRCFPSAITITPPDITTSPLPFAVSIRVALSRCSSALTAVSDNINNLPLPDAVPSKPSVPELTDIDVRLPGAQKHIAVVVNSARWMDVFGSASLPLRARMLSMSTRGAMSALTAVPSTHRGQLLPLSFITAAQLSLRLPLSLLLGLRTCSCGKPLDAFGDHVLSCNHFTEKKKPGHNLVENVVSSLARAAGHDVSHDSRRPHRGHRAYSPNWCPDLTCLFGTPNHTHILVDITCPSVVSAAALPIASTDPRALSLAHEANKRRTYGVVAPHVVLPFVLDDSGGLGKEAWTFLLQCRDRAGSQLAPRDFERMNWSCAAFTTYYLQSLSLASVKGWGHFFMVVSSILRGGRGRGVGGV